VHEGAGPAFGKKQVIPLARWNKHAAGSVEMPPIPAKELHPRDALPEILGLVVSRRDGEIAPSVDESEFAVRIAAHYRARHPLLEAEGLVQDGWNGHAALVVYIAPAAVDFRFDRGQAFGEPARPIETCGYGHGSGTIDVSPARRSGFRAGGPQAYGGNPLPEVHGRQRAGGTDEGPRLIDVTPCLGFRAGHGDGGQALGKTGRQGEPGSDDGLIPLVAITPFPIFPERLEHACPS